MKTKLVIFGISGDLSRRKLLPALRSMIKHEEFDSLEIIGVSRRELNVNELFGDTKLAAQSTLFTMDMAHQSEYERLKAHIALGSDEQLIIYLSVPPGAARQIITLLGEAGFTTPNVKLLLEKPFGLDLASAEDTKRHIDQYFRDDHIYRIDHYLAKEMAQNIIAVRGGNALFSHLWDGVAIDRVEVVATEQIGIEGRADFYEQTGALRDVVQGHLMQLMALILMDVPHGFDWDEAPKLRLEALKSILPADPRKACRLQYETYQDDTGNAGSLTETFVALELASSDKRWKNVKLQLITGKALDEKTTEIRVHFKKFHAAQSNRLIFRIQPNEGVEIELYVKKAGYEQAFERQKLQFGYPEDDAIPDAYEQVLVDAIRSRKSLFASSEEVLQSWKILAHVQQAWAMDGELPRTYKNGSPYTELVEL